MKKMFLLALCVLVFASLAMAQVTYTGGATGIGSTGPIDKLGAHQNGGRGCVGCHAPHSGAWGNGGNKITGTVTDADTGNETLWGEDLGPLYNVDFGFGNNGASVVNVADSTSPMVSGILMCLSCHDGNVAQGAMMDKKSWEQAMGLLPTTYGSADIPTLLGNDGTGAGNYKNDHPVGPDATLGAVGVAKWFSYAAAGCGSTTKYDCMKVTDATSDYGKFIDQYGAFQISGTRTSAVVMPDQDPNNAYVVCTTCHTPHTMYTFKGTAAKVNGLYPTYFFIAAPYNPGAKVTSAAYASSATQFCRQCHFTGAGGSNEGSGIYGVKTQF